MSLFYSPHNSHCQHIRIRYPTPPGKVQCLTEGFGAGRLKDGSNATKKALGLL